MIDPGSLLWELRGQSGKPVTCSLELHRGLYRLYVRMGDEELHRDTYTTEADAIGQAAFFFKDFTSSGWTVTYRRDFLY